MLDSFQGQEDFTALDADGQIFQPIRDINADMEKIMENLPCKYFLLFPQYLQIASSCDH